MLLSPLLLAFFASTAVAEKFGYALTGCGPQETRRCKTTYNAECVIYGDNNGKHTTQVCVHRSGTCDCGYLEVGNKLYPNKYGYTCGC
ncbi:hypothetical protein PTNB73_10051 [Pyrenophora teres f. teres]|uniref:Uncharacterized protein n=1 Tax=Pyrenophora teres f. teres TaxID=97479 RepID=A0A6S6WGG2_9PLEO|nr:hypothetical protein PTNB85_10168 [Pyrenophora teres f. teres]KAE8854627.1 hypothetical protein PTNB29_09983 [Pyrenophora teres f. teres]KAE8855765.1 hypothetical protein PTNB73_10051 [Pyrenophora teres f. teres]CAE7218177.1 hypothetical protein PTTW11_11004 [Pyrenophora teres f. teres]